MGSFRFSRLMLATLALAILLPSNPAALPVEKAIANHSQCSDGVDNDDDDRIDYPTDNDCMSVDDDNEGVDNGIFITVSDERDAVAAGDGSRYIITLRQERDAVKLVDLQFHVPPQVGLTYASDDGVLRDGSVFWPKVAVFKGHIRRLSVHTVISPYAREGGLIVTRAIANGSAATDTTNVLLSGNIPYPHNQLQVSVSDHRDNVLPGDVLDYSIIVKNPTDRAVIAGVRAGVPTALSVIDAREGAVRMGNDIVWRDVVFPPNQDRVFTFRVSVDPRVPNRYPIQVVARAGSVIAYDRTVTGSGIGGSYSLFSTITDNRETVARGELLQYTIHIDNTSGRLEPDSSINAGLPIWAEFVSATEGGAWDGRNVRWQHVQVAPGGTRDLHFAIRVRSDAPAGAALRGTVFLQGSQSTDVTTVVDGVAHIPTALYLRTPARPLPYYPYPAYRNAAPDIDSSSLQVTKTADRSEIRAGETVSYTLSIRNNAGAVIRDILVDDAYNDSQVEIIDSGGASQSANGKLLWRIDRLNPSETRTLTYSARAARSLRAGTVIRNTAQAYASELGGDAPGDLEDVDVRYRTTVDDSQYSYDDYGDDEYPVMPRTGVMDEFFRPMEDTGQFLTPVSAAAHGNALPLLVWIAIGGSGLLGGAALGKKFVG